MNESGMFFTTCKPEPLQQKITGAEAEPLEKKKGAGAEPLEKKQGARAGAAKKNAAPQPWFNTC